MNKFCSSSNKVSTHYITWLFSFWIWRRRCLKFAWFWPCGALPLGPHGGHTYYLNNFESPTPKDDSCQVWLKSNHAFSRRRWKCKKFTDENGRKRTAIAHSSLRLRWAKNADNRKKEEVKWVKYSSFTIHLTDWFNTITFTQMYSTWCMSVGVGMDLYRHSEMTYGGGGVVAPAKWSKKKKKKKKKVQTFLCVLCSLYICRSAWRVWIQKQISIFINLRYLWLKMLKNKENNKKICHIFHHNFKNIPCYVMSEVSLKRVYFALFDDGLTLKTLKMFFIGFWIQTLHICIQITTLVGTDLIFLLVSYPICTPPPPRHPYSFCSLCHSSKWRAVIFSERKLSNCSMQPHKAYIFHSM